MSNLLRSVLNNIFFIYCALGLTPVGGLGVARGLVVDIVDTNDGVAAFEELYCEVEADKADGTCD